MLFTKTTRSIHVVNFHIICQFTSRFIRLKISFTSFFISLMFSFHFSLHFSFHFSSHFLSHYSFHFSSHFLKVEIQYTHQLVRVCMTFNSQEISFIRTWIFEEKKYCYNHVLSRYFIENFRTNNIFLMFIRVELELITMFI